MQRARELESKKRERKPEQRSETEIERTKEQKAEEITFKGSDSVRFYCHVEEKVLIKQKKEMKNERKQKDLMRIWEVLLCEKET